MTSKNHPVAMITGGTRGIGSGNYCWYLVSCQFFTFCFFLLFDRHCWNVCWRWIWFNTWISWKCYCSWKIQESTFAKTQESKCNTFKIISYLLQIFYHTIVYFIVENWTNSRQYSGWKNHHKLFWNCGYEIWWKLECFSPQCLANLCTWGWYPSSIWNWTIPK